jgi:hypothetical protein
MDGLFKTGNPAGLPDIPGIIGLSPSAISFLLYAKTGFINCNVILNVALPCLIISGT